MSQQPPNQPPYGQPLNQPPYGQPPMGQPMYGQPPAPIKKRRAPILLIILGVLGVLLLACVGGFFLLFAAASTAKTDGEKTVTQLMTTLKQGDSAGAMALCTSTVTADEIQTLIGSAQAKNFNAIKSTNNPGYNNANGTETQSFSGVMDYGSVGTGTFDAKLEKVGGSWRIQTIRLSPISASIAPALAAAA